jgi:hypothetical protein
MRTYHVQVGDEYSFLRRDTSIAEARAWAKTAFPRQRIVVRVPPVFCEACQSAPCCCMVREDV